MWNDVSVVINGYEYTMMLITWLGLLWCVVSYAAVGTTIVHSCCGDSMNQGDYIVMGAGWLLSPLLALAYVTSLPLQVAVLTIDSFSSEGK